MQHTSDILAATKTQKLMHKLVNIFLLICLFVPMQALAQSNMDIFGYFSTRYEKVFSEPEVQNGKIVRRNVAPEWSNPFMNVMLQHQLGNEFRVFLNLNGAGDGNVEVRNFWGEYTFAPIFRIRLGRVYRKFGLYNEILDAVPTYYGIEPPELFDSDHLIVSRTSTLMVFGNADLGVGQIEYSLATDNGEGGPSLNMIPVGWDLRYRQGIDFLIGLSGYFSGGETTSDVSVGEGSPSTGVMPWMSADAFSVIGGFTEIIHEGLTLQGAYWYSSHDALRNPESIVNLVNGTTLNSNQLNRFLIDPTGPLEQANVNTDGSYAINTWYLRAGYSIYTSRGEIAPYLQWDWYDNPETIASKKWGGDNEAGVSDNGTFNKATVGVVYRPVPNVAIKLDGSSHIYKLNGEQVQYPEIRFDVSYVFGQ